ncbi:hypothetical protein CF5_0020 [Staphylococcus phage CF5]|uniref:Uncharacterized protein n=1 Tax=Staphylococcus phage CF5 TaxID=3113739 RepID=A0AAX4J769_9CAUD|nr:hypothetical protein CF5_0020 [Staphylococcus phage CF5]
MFITKKELKEINVKEQFEAGVNFIKITDGRHSLYNTPQGIKVVDYKTGLGLTTTSKFPKYIQQALNK